MHDDTAYLHTIRSAVRQGDWDEARSSLAEGPSVRGRHEEGFLHKLLSKAIDLKDLVTANSVLMTLELNPPRSGDEIDEAFMQRQRLLSRWSQLVGRFLMSFAEIEAMTYLGLRALPKDPIFESVVSMSFGSRVGLLKAIISGRRQDAPALVDWVIGLLDEAVKLAKVRNLVAHNPIQMSVYETSDGSYVFAEEISHHTKTTQTLSYEQMRLHMMSAANLEQELVFAMQYLVEEIAG